MTQPAANCPNCGAKIVFRWSSCVQTVCEYCKSILVRTDVDLKKVGQVADLPPDSSPIQLNTEGIYRNKAFVVVGRIVYEYGQGAWNEWHVIPRLHDFVYSPWLTANLVLDRYPDSRGAEPSWDTVFLDSPTLDYVDAMHQSLRTHIDRTVWTFYWALAEGSPAQNRQLLLDKDWSYWREGILHDLERVHRDIRQCVSRIDIMRMGHSMVRPAVGSIFSEERRHLARFHDRIFFANSDLGGISIFEEAQYHGVEAAQRLLARLRGAS